MRFDEMTITDWKLHGLSQRNKKFYAIRKKHTNKAVFLKATYNRSKSTITLYFKVYPTYAAGKELVTVIDIKGNEYKDYFYRILVQFCKVNELIKTKDEWLALSHKDKFYIISNMIDSWEYVKFHSNDPSFYWQGVWKLLDDLDSAVYKFPGRPDKGIWSARHGNGGIYLTKHFVLIFEIIKFNINEIIKAIDNEFKSKGYNVL